MIYGYELPNVYSWPWLRVNFLVCVLQAGGKKLGQADTDVEVRLQMHWRSV